VGKTETIRHLCPAIVVFRLKINWTAEVEFLLVRTGELIFFYVVFYLGKATHKFDFTLTVKRDLRKL